MENRRWRRGAVFGRGLPGGASEAGEAGFDSGRDGVDMVNECGRKGGVEELGFLGEISFSEEGTRRGVCWLHLERCGRDVWAYVVYLYGRLPQCTVDNHDVCVVEEVGGQRNQRKDVQEYLRGCCVSPLPFLRASIAVSVEDL
jgi:hypothetical protein